MAQPHAAPVLLAHLFVRLPTVTLALTLALSAEPCGLPQVIVPVPTPTPTPTPPPTETSDDLFNSNVLHDLFLSINPSDLQTLRAHYGENTYYPADLKWRTTTVRNVAIRSRGAASRNPDKPGLYIDVNRQTPGQTFLGLKALVLDNLVQDDAMMREAVAMMIFARMGQPASRVAFCRLYLNNDYEGLYLMVENVDKPFLQRTFGRDDGYLFEYQWSQRFDGEYLGDDLGLYRALFEARTYSDESDRLLYEPIRALFEAINASEEVKGRAELEALIDLPQFVRVLAIEKAMSEVDGLAGFFGLNNFYPYRDKDSGRHSFLIWDRDRALTSDLLRASIFFGTADNRVARRALGYSDLYSLYLETAEATAEAMRGNEWLSSEVDRIWALVREAAHADTHKPYANADVDTAVELLRQIAVDRPDIVLTELAGLRGGLRR